LKYIILIALLTTSIVHSSPIKEIHWGTEVWEGYTDEDGSGIFTKVLERVFETQGVQLLRTNYPLKRALYLTRNGTLDLAGGIPKDIKKSTQHIQAKYPIVITKISAFYHKDTILDWNGLESIKGKKIVSTHIVGANLGLKSNEYIEVATRKQIINLILRKRYDIYIDAHKLLLTTVKAHNKKFIESDYKIETLISKGWYLISTNNERGREVISLFEKGMETLQASGELKKLYDEAGLSTPLIQE